MLNKFSVSFYILVLLINGPFIFGLTFHPNEFSFQDNLKVSSESAYSTNELESNPPDHTEYAKMARYLVHKAEWTSMGTISTLNSLQGFPMVNIIAIADSPVGEKSTGNMYFYLTMLDFTAQDLSKDNRLTVLLSMDQDLSCTKQGIDPMEPTCARIMMSGNAVKLDNSTEEYEFGFKSMMSHHPAAQTWIKTHSFFLCKLNISQIAVLDYYGGPHYVNVDDYYKVDADLADYGEIPYEEDFMAYSNSIL